MRRTVLITGASSGLGAEMARQLAGRGHDVALCARRTDRLEEVRRQILAAHPERRVVVRPMDVTDHDQVLEVTRAVRLDLGTLDRVVVNAGVAGGARLGTGKVEANRQIATTNFVAALVQTEAALEAFREQESGHLVMVSSMAAMRALPGQMATYAATKAGVAHLAEGVRTELHGRPGFAVTVLYPGFIDSEMTAGARGPQRLLIASTRRGVASMVAAMEKEVPSACVPRVPWALLKPVIRHAPAGLLRGLG